MPKTYLFGVHSADFLGSHKCFKLSKVQICHLYIDSFKGLPQIENIDGTFKTGEFKTKLLTGKDCSKKDW